MERKLATLRIVSKLEPIEGADRIELATVDGWKVVVAKDVGHKVGDMVVYCEIDSFLPIRPEYEFLRKTSFKKMGDFEGFRLKTTKFRGTISNGLILPLHALENDNKMKIGVSRQPHGDQLQLGPYDDAFIIEVGADVTELLGIVKYDPPMPACLNAVAKGYFPGFIPKSDEIRCQNFTASEYESLREKEYYVAEKLDGSSVTFFLHDNEFGVCSRNLELIEDDTNSIWKVARELKIEEKLRGCGIPGIMIQGEIIGEGIQKNSYKIKGQTVKFFTAYNIGNRSRYKFNRFEEIIRDLGLETVPILSQNIKLPDNIEDLVKSADGKSILNKNTNREGLVYRSLDGEISFKCIGNEFLIKETD